MKPEHNSTNSAPSARFYTIPQAARQLGIPAYKIRRAVKLNLLASYGVLDGRQYVRIEDIEAAMARRTEVASDQASFQFAEITVLSGGSL